MTRQSIIIISIIAIFTLGISYIILISKPSNITPLQNILIPPSPTLLVTPAPQEQQVRQPSHIDIDNIPTIVDSKTSEEEIQKIGSLPIYIENFTTSKGVATINIFSLPGEPKSILHLEIYGPNYNYSDSTLENPHATVFYEAFIEAKRQLNLIGIDPKKINFVYGTRQYIQDTAANWVESFGLLK